MLVAVPATLQNAPPTIREMPPELEAELPQAGPDPVPASISRFQARAVMRRILMPDGKTALETVAAMLEGQATAAAALPPLDPARLSAEDAWEAWEQATVFERHSPMISAIAAGLGLSEEQLDNAFRDAAGISA